MRRNKKIRQIPNKRIAEFVAKVKKLLSPFPEYDNANDDFFLRKAEELYNSEYR